MEVFLNRVGFIEKGDDQGNYIMVEFDEDDTGGYYIYQAPVADVLNSEEGYDNWVESFEDVLDFFKESEWQIKWLL